ncbi:TIGR04222 domain-containing membrane protein, partial [Mariniblastus sp.]|nr:TIGR04222 domain-containing membrane protein [Mariniblastus sp.]
MVVAQFDVFNWSANWFLALYIVCLVGTCIWIYLSRDRVMKKFELSSGTDSELDIYETAVLIGGPPRLYQLAVMELLDAEAATYEKKFFLRQSRLLFNQQPTVKLDPAPDKLLETIWARGDKGFPVKEVPNLLKSTVGPYQAVLAKHGFKPTPAEWRKACLSLTVPLIAIGGIGVVRLINGVWANRPVGFLLILIFATVISAIGVFAIMQRVTNKGNELVEQLKSSITVDEDDSSNKSQSGETDAMLGFAILGTAALL